MWAGITWEQEEMKTWRNDVLMKFLHHPDLAPSKHKPGALYDAFTKTSVLGSEHILALSFSSSDPSFKADSVNRILMGSLLVLDIPSEGTLTLYQILSKAQSYFPSVIHISSSRALIAEAWRMVEIYSQRIASLLSAICRSARMLHMSPQLLFFTLLGKVRKNYSSHRRQDPSPPPYAKNL
ncbi:hypothetical protein GLOIN_2v1886148 [Rhizophagus clarus]|uniref:Uncharacterized protein n=1 Tax=Rhizophagus clarus TaxID=94130 RepID=A0A8H3LLI4_9GLOM|nr:hypothetical protein GLOIN_2v1886148 [Rhizophagus clarus]